MPQNISSNVSEKEKIYLKSTNIFNRDYLDKKLFIDESNNLDK